MITKNNRYDRYGDTYTVYGLATTGDGYSRERGSVTIELTQAGLTDCMTGAPIKLALAERGLTGWGWLDCNRAYHLAAKDACYRIAISGKSWDAAYADMVARRPEWAAKVAIQR